MKLKKFFALISCVSAIPVNNHDDNGNSEAQPYAPIGHQPYYSFTPQFVQLQPHEWYQILHDFQSKVDTVSCEWKQPVTYYPPAFTFKFQQFVCDGGPVHLIVSNEYGLFAFGKPASNGMMPILYAGHPMGSFPVGFDQYGTYRMGPAAPNEQIAGHTTYPQGSYGHTTGTYPQQHYDTQAYIGQHHNNGQSYGYSDQGIHQQEYSGQDGYQPQTYQHRDNAIQQINQEYLDNFQEKSDSYENHGRISQPEEHDTKDGYFSDQNNSPIQGDEEQHYDYEANYINGEDDLVIPHEDELHGNLLNENEQIDRKGGALVDHEGDSKEAQPIQYDPIKFGDFETDEEFDELTDEIPEGRSDEGNQATDDSNGMASTTPIDEADVVSDKLNERILQEGEPEINNDQLDQQESNHDDVNEPIDSYPDDQPKKADMIPDDQSTEGSSSLALKLETFKTIENQKDETPHTPLDSPDMISPDGEPTGEPKGELSGEMSESKNSVHKSGGKKPKKKSSIEKSNEAISIVPSKYEMDRQKKREKQQALQKKLAEKAERRKAEEKEYKEIMRQIRDKRPHKDMLTEAVAETVKKIEPEVTKEDIADQLHLTQESMESPSDIDNKNLKEEITKVTSEAMEEGRDNNFEFDSSEKVNTEVSNEAYTLIFGNPKSKTKGKSLEGLMNTWSKNMISQGMQIKLRDLDFVKDHIKLLAGLYNVELGDNDFDLHHLKSMANLFHLDGVDSMRKNSAILLLTTGHVIMEKMKPALKSIQNEHANFFNVMVEGANKGNVNAPIQKFNAKTGFKVTKQTLKPLRAIVNEARKKYKSISLANQFLIETKEIINDSFRKLGYGWIAHNIVGAYMEETQILQMQMQILNNWIKQTETL